MHRVFDVALSGHCISCIYKPTKNSKYVYSLLVYNKNHIQTIQYTKNINDAASLVEAVGTIQKEYRSPGHYQIQFDDHDHDHVHVQMLTKVKGKKDMFYLNK